jgi:hypothetical protein
MLALTIPIEMLSEMDSRRVAKFAHRQNGALQGIRGATPLWHPRQRCELMLNVQKSTAGALNHGGE